MIGSGSFGPYELYVVPILLSVVYVWGTLGSKAKWNERLRRFRLLDGAGFVATCFAIFLGAIWPSLSTIVAILVLPAAVLLLVAIIRPAIVSARPLVRKYVIAAVAVSGLLWIVQACWEFAQ